MLICFVILSLDSFHKYTDGKTSMTEANQLVFDEPLPSFSICSNPAFDNRYLTEEMGLHPAFFYFTEAGSSGGGDQSSLNLSLNFHQLWDRASFRPDVISVGFDMFVHDQPYNENYSVEVGKFKVFNSLWYGSCRNIELIQAKRAKEMLGIMLMSLK